MRLTFVLLTSLLVVGCRSGGGSGGMPTELPLQWRGVRSAVWPNPAVASAFSSTPFVFKLRDARPDPTVVGGYDNSDIQIRTRDNVGEYITMKMGQMLTSAGARFGESGLVLEAEVLEYSVIEGGVFNGQVRIRAIVHRGGGEAWSKMYIGKSKRWGRSHSPENMNEALSNALQDATSRLVADEEFAHALAPSGT